MKDYKDITIEKLCELINYLDDQGALLDEEKENYEKIMLVYRKQGFGPIERDGYHTFIEYTENGVDEVLFFDDDFGADHACYNAAKIICYGDCNGAELKRLVCRGYELEYVGWQPNMLFEFRQKGTHDEACWSEYYPEWEH